MKSILDKEFEYTPSFETDVKKTFERIRVELKAKREREEENRREAKQKTVTMRRA